MSNNVEGNYVAKGGRQVNRLNAVQLTVANAAWVYLVITTPMFSWIGLLVAYGMVGSLLSTIALTFDDEQPLNNLIRIGFTYLLGLVLWLPIVVLLTVATLIPHLTGDSSS